MPTHTNDHYLSAKILTATPQKLHLMLIEGAIRHALVAKRLWEVQDRRAERDEALARCIDITGELVLGVKDSEEAVAKTLVDLYVFIFRAVSEAKILEEVAKLDDALRILAIERETWRQVCEKEDDTPVSNRQELAATPPAHHAPNPLGTLPILPVTGGGLSLEA